jgi:hypothetical protein
MEFKKLKMSEVNIDDLKPYDKNPRKNDAQVERMVASIQEFGFRIPVVAKSDGTVVDGHLRLKAAIRLKMQTVPVVCADELTEAQVKAFRLLANRSANWAEWDVEMLAEELRSLELENFDLGMTGFSDTEISDVLDSININFSGDDSPGIDGEGLGKGKTHVKVVLGAGCVDVLERAIEKTGHNNREDAVREICEAYLEKG